MLTKRSAQEDILNSDNQYLEFVGKNTIYGYLAAHRHEIFRDEDFAMLYCDNNGRGSVPPRRSRKTAEVLRTKACWRLHCYCNGMMGPRMKRRLIE